MEIITHDELIGRIDAFLCRHDMTDSSFSRAATGEPGLVARIREGSSPTLKVLQRIAAFMAERDADLAAKRAASSEEGSQPSIRSAA